MERITYQGRIVEVVEKEVSVNGKVRIFEYARRSPGVRLIIPKGSDILLTKEFRTELGSYDYRLPGGKVFDTLEEYRASSASLDESARTAAIKEAQEEAGISIEELEHFHTSVCGATIVWDLLYFVVKKFSETEQHLEDGEDIAVEWMSCDEVRRMCLDGSISEERSALVLLRYLDSKI
jgi:ADP-ribose pyrophosphatase